MPESKTKRRGHGEDSIYYDADRNRYVGSISVGYGPNGRRLRRKVTGRTKQEVRDKLKATHTDLDAGLKAPGSYTVRHAVDAWLKDGLDGQSERTKKLYTGLLGPLMDLIGKRQLRDLSAGEVRDGLVELTDRYSTRSLQITRNSLERAIAHAQADDLVGRNVAGLVKTPRGRTGRPSKSFTVDEARMVLAAVQGRRLEAYVTLSLLAGIRTEEARALRWDDVVVWVDDATGWRPVTEVGFDGHRAGEARFAIYVWRAERAGGDTKTQKSRRTLLLPQKCVEALRKLWVQQEQDRERAGELWQENGLLFASRVGTALTAENVIRAFRIITKAAGLGEDWVPREMRHTFVSVLSANDVPVESISLLVGHDRTATTELIYRHEIWPALTRGAEIMDKIFA
jgi:integrase